ncbi:hypothetical protein IGI04_013473 [Brassica rapa subsp. trilocularis]|uniref:Uncharacterized protein n=1 Tax=Brassica rapa subsp. trilocularis TaxID=1813537 RepID=A0ABQ7NC84_BRACM|nr:hypothetical protein IGI04_013473 [Brassica rapa subsp. trilocularis]
MVRTVKTLVSFVLTIFLFISFNNCRTITAETPSTTLDFPDIAINIITNLADVLTSKDVVVIEKAFKMK